MNFENRLFRLSLAMNEVPQKPDFDNMSEAELESYVIRDLNDDIKQLKNIAHYHHLKIVDGKSFMDVLKIYQEKYCSDSGREIYSDKFIEISGQLFDEYKNRLSV